MANHESSHSQSHSSCSHPQVYIPGGKDATQAAHSTFDGRLLNIPPTNVSESILMVKRIATHTLAMNHGGSGGGGGGGGSTFHGECPVHRDERMAIFGYGSNSIAQIRTICENPKLKSVPAKLHGFARCFAGRSLSRQNGAVATIVPMANHVVLGSISYLTQSEIHKFDSFLGVDVRFFF